MARWTCAKRSCTERKVPMLLLHLGLQPLLQVLDLGEPLPQRRNVGRVSSDVEELNEIGMRGKQERGQFSRFQRTRRDGESRYEVNQTQQLTLNIVPISVTKYLRKVAMKENVRGRG